MRDEHLDTIPKKESDEFIKSSVENLVPSPSESEDECENDVPACDDFITFSNLLFDADEDFSSRIDEADCDPEEEIRLIEKLFDSLVEEIDLALTPDDSMPPETKDDDYDSKRDILIFEELLSKDSILILKNESFHFDIPSSPRPPAKPLDNDEIGPNLGILTVKMVGDISEHYVPMPRLLTTQPTLGSNQEKSPHLLSHRGLNFF
uniref:Reverse transcriptase domain-containing protein n=1 Tax=Tanacetum cinerariifolium TaxID=118510 RepID=A0A6L2KZ63_TANCI|nr:hypothetical protein [Tanacetum cinerariifolium]